MLVQASEAIRLSGLTAHQLREWCGRRELVAADVPSAGRGHLALYSWQTILALRILNELRIQYSVEVGSWQGAIAELQVLLRKRPFPSLWGHVAIFLDTQSALLASAIDSASHRRGLIIDLDHHLEVLATHDEIGADAQLQLFPVMAVR